MLLSLLLLPLSLAQQPLSLVLLSQQPPSLLLPVPSLVPAPATTPSPPPRGWANAAVTLPAPAVPVLLAAVTPARPVMVVPVPQLAPAVPVLLVAVTPALQLPVMAVPARQHPVLQLAQPVATVPHPT